MSPADANTPQHALTPTGYERTTGGNVQWKPPTVEHLQALLPQYEILSLLGHGGMGAVYKARQKTLDRLVAIKILPIEAADDGEANFVERFKNEARTMGKMNHPPSCMCMITARRWRGSSTSSWSLWTARMCRR